MKGEINLLMKIKELEELLGIPRATIRFYEKQGLITPGRNRENEYREYSDEDIAKLKKILILRKLGFSVSAIEDLFDETADLESLLVQQIDELEKQRKDIDGAIYICKEMKNSSISIETLDEEYYWDEISKKEDAGYSFIDFLSADMKIVLYDAAPKIEYSPGHGPRTPDLIWNPMQKMTRKIGSFWEKHRTLQVILIIVILLISLAFVIAVSMMGG